MVNLALNTIGHNNPPSDKQILEDSLTLRHVGLLKEADGYIDTAQKIPENFVSDNEANYAADFIKRIKSCQKVLENTRKEEKEPFLRQGQYVDAFFKETVDKLEIATRKANTPLNAFLQAKARKEQEERQREAEQLRKEQEAALATRDVAHIVEIAGAVQVAEKSAAVPLTALASAEGAFSKAGLQKKWVGLVVDKGSLDLEKLRPYLKDDALQVALNAFIKFGGRECNGAKIEEIMETKVS